MQKQQPGILRRSSTTDANKGYTGNRSTRTIDTESSDNTPISPAGSDGNTLIRDVDELADRLLKFKHSFEPGSKGGRATQSYLPKSANHRRRTLAPPPPPPQGQLYRRNSEKSKHDAADEYRMTGAKLDNSERSVRGGAPSSEYWSNDTQNREMHGSFNVTPSKRHVVSSPPSSHPELPFSPKSPSSSSQVSLRSRSRGRERSKSIDRVRNNPPFDQPNDHSDPNPRRDHADPNPRRGRHRIDAPKSPSASSTMSRRSSSRSRMRGRSKSTTRMPTNSNHMGDNNHGTSNVGMREKSVDRQRGSRTRSPHKSRGSQLSNSSNRSSREKGWTRALGTIRGKFTSQKTSSADLSQDASTQRSRSRSRDERRVKESSKDGGMSLENGPRGLGKGKRGDKETTPLRMSATHDGRFNGKMTSLDHNPFDHNPFLHDSAKAMTMNPRQQRRMSEKSGCSSPLSNEASFDSDHLDEETMRKMETLLKGGEISGDVSNNSSLSYSPLRGTSRGRARSNNSRRSPSRERSLSAGRAGRRPNKMFGRVPEKFDSDTRKVNNVVDNMPFQDQCGDFGIYSGQVNEDGRPNGKGTMKYDNGIFYEGLWTDGCQEERAMTQYHRVRSGFTSWKGQGRSAVKSGRTMPWNAHKIDKNKQTDKTYVRGLVWVDLNCDAGRYTGEVKDEIPHGKGIMKYDFGLIVEGEWVNGVLREGPQDRMLPAATRSRGQIGNDDAKTFYSSMSAIEPGPAHLGIVSSMPSTGISLGGGFSVGPGLHVSHNSVYSGMPQIGNPAMTTHPQPQLVMIPQTNNNTAFGTQQDAMSAGVMYRASSPSMIQNQVPGQQMQMQTNEYYRSTEQGHSIHNNVESNFRI